MVEKNPIIGELDRDFLPANLGVMANEQRFLAQHDGVFENTRVGDIMTAWELIGFDGLVRIKGGRAVYDAVTYYDDTPGEMVKLSRLETSDEKGIYQVNRWVRPETELEIV